MKTIKRVIKIAGHGIHSGEPVTMTLRPSRRPGIFMRRTDLAGTEKIAATFDNVGATHLRNTTIGNPVGAHVQTVEHLMAALFMAGIDSVVIDIDGPETPILDGSAREFYDAIAAAADGQSAPMHQIVVRRPVVATATEIMRTLPKWTRIRIWVMNKLAGRRSDGYVKLCPGDAGKLTIGATLVYPEPIIGRQSYTYTYDGTKKSIATFVRDVARARTFGKYSEWEYLKRHGMGRGANEHNVIALNDAGDGTLNPVQWPDEFVRHKIIDAIGDMFTSGGFVCGTLESYKGSHALNNLVLKKLFSDPANYDIIETKTNKGKRK